MAAHATLIADRFILHAGGTAIDLATGRRVELITCVSGGVSDQAKWAMRCDRLARLHHRSIARLLDYGPLGETHRFEAWGADGPWCGSIVVREGVTARVDEFLRKSGWSTAPLSPDTVRSVDGRAVVVPGPAVGYDAPDDVRPAADGVVTSASVLGMLAISRDSVAIVADMFRDHVERQCRAISVRGPAGSGSDTAVNEIARAARLCGYVPLAADLASYGAIAGAAGRSIALIVRRDVAHGWRTLVQLSLASARPHLIVFVGDHDIRGVRGVTLARVAEKKLEEAIQPRTVPPWIAKGISAAARRAHGLPGRFAALIWGDPDMPDSVDNKPASRVAETALQYGGEPLANIQERPTSGAAWPAPGELALLRKRLQAATALNESGRHASGDRALRQLAGALARRQDWLHAAQADLALAASLSARGRPEDALTALARARESAAHLDQNDLLLRIAIATGLALTDRGRLDEAECTLTGVVSAAAGLAEGAVGVSARLALARCRFWHGRFEAAADCLNTLDSKPLSEEEAIRLKAMRSRIAVGCSELKDAVAEAGCALDMARRSARSDLVAVAARAAALAHLAVSDHEAVQADAILAIQAARRAHAPLDALRARLLMAESQRRQGRNAVAIGLCDRIARIRSHALPAILRVRVELLKQLLSEERGDHVLTRLVQTTGFGALSVFTPGPPSSCRNAAVADIVTILQCCQSAEEDRTVLTTLCERLRHRLQAAGVAFFLEERGAFTTVASDGARVEPALAPRVVDIELPIAPHFVNGRVEGGAPIRYGGRRLGALIARWPLGIDSDAKTAAMLMATAATAAAPALAAVAASRVTSAPRTIDLIGTSAAMADVRRAIERAASAPFSVLVEGESGSGKELVARALHRHGARRDRPFGTLNCAALPDELVESELFGHSRGAFTGAVAERPGVFEEAHTGTLFLDEIGELSLRAQAKVLRTIQEGELRRVGENVPRRIDVRLVAATNRDLRQEVAAGRFRLDLLYRLDVIRISLPPLRDRRDDIPLLAEHFWREATARIGSRAALSAATLSRLARYDWPGNVRELQNVLAALAVGAPRRGVIQPSALPPQLHDQAADRMSRLDVARRTFDTHFVRAALARTGGHRARAAHELGLTRQGLTKLIVRLGLNRP